MDASRILVIGGSGFLGRSLVARLSECGHEVLVPTRRRDRARTLAVLPRVQVLETTDLSAAGLTKLLRGCSAVVNLVGVLHSSPGEPWGPEFDAAHVRLPARLVQACRDAGVRRLLHVSALGLGDAQREDFPSMYLRSKAAGERIVRAADDLDWTIFQPSVVFGPQDRFLNTFARMQVFAPFVPLARAESRLQPVHVADVAAAIANALSSPATFRRAFELAGPEVFTLGQLVRLAGEWSGSPRPVLALPFTLGQAQAGILGCLPGRVMTIDNFDSLSMDNVARGPIAPELGVTPQALACARQWLRRR